MAFLCTKADFRKTIEKKYWICSINRFYVSCFEYWTKMFYNPVLLCGSKKYITTRRSACVSVMQYETTKVSGCTTGVSTTYLLIYCDSYSWVTFLYECIRSEFDMHRKRGWQSKLLAKFSNYQKIESELVFRATEPENLCMNEMKEKQEFYLYYPYFNFWWFETLKTDQVFWQPTYFQTFPLQFSIA